MQLSSEHLSGQPLFLRTSVKTCAECRIQGGLKGISGRFRACRMLVAERGAYPVFAGDTGVVNRRCLHCVSMTLFRSLFPLFLILTLIPYARYHSAFFVCAVSVAADAGWFCAGG
jgi:hypothetical protein